MLKGLQVKQEAYTCRFGNQWIPYMKWLGKPGLFQPKKETAVGSTTGIYEIMGKVNTERLFTIYPQTEYQTRTSLH